MNKPIKILDYRYRHHIEPNLQMDIDVLPNINKIAASIAICVIITALATTYIYL